MSDLERLNEALEDAWERCLIREQKREPEIVAVFAAARAYRDLLVNGERAWFCGEHASFGGPKRCQTGAQIAPDVCLMVPGRFVPVQVHLGEET